VARAAERQALDAKDLKVSAYTKDIVQVGAWAVAIVGGLVAAFMAVAQFRRANDQRREDLRWKQAELAKRCLDEIRGDDLACAAMKMLDWVGLTYEKPGGGKTGAIDHNARRAALRTTNTFFVPDDDSPFIRDAYDALFDRFERLEHFIRIHLITFEDVEPAFLYYVERMAGPEDRSVFAAFLESYGFGLAQSFIGRFRPWKGMQDAGGKMFRAEHGGDDRAA